jgi:hypothetical protein
LNDTEDRVAREGTSPRSRREKKMTDKNSQLRLSAGTVPDPFGLARDPERQALDEEATDPDSHGSTASEDTDRDNGAATGEPEHGSVRLGELD